MYSPQSTLQCILYPARYLVLVHSVLSHHPLTQIYINNKAYNFMNSVYCYYGYLYFCGLALELPAADSPSFLFVTFQENFLAFVGWDSDRQLHWSGYPGSLLFKFPLSSAAHSTTQAAAPGAAAQAGDHSVAWYAARAGDHSAAHAAAPGAAACAAAQAAEWSPA